MWIASTLGFFSIVQHYDEHRGRGCFYVRARAKQDLRNLRTRARINAGIQEWPGADYAYRLVVSGDELTRIMTTLTSTIRYPNFKDCIAQLPDQAPKLEAYHRLWASLLGLQNGWMPGRAPASQILNSRRSPNFDQQRSRIHRMGTSESESPVVSVFRARSSRERKPTMTMGEALVALKKEYGAFWGTKFEGEQAYEIAQKMGLSDEDAAQAYYAAGTAEARVKQAWDWVYARGDFQSEDYAKPSEAAVNRLGKVVDSCH